MNKRNTAIDFSKYVASLFIIGIHASLFHELSDTVSFFAIHVVFRFAVPFFAISTGYFIASKINAEKKDCARKTAKRILLKQEMKLIKLYCVCTVLYLLFSIPTWVKTGWFSLWAFVDYGLASVVSGSHYHLWYLLGLIYALPLLWFCIRFIDRKWWIALICLLWMIKVLSYGYIKWMPEQIQNIVAKLEYFSGLMNGAFCLLPFLLMGFLIQSSRVSYRKCFPALWLVSFAFLSTEAFLLKSFHQENVSFILFTLPTAFLTFMLLKDARIHVRPTICTKLGAMSVFVYCFHPMILESVDPFISNSIILFCVTALASSLLSWILVMFKQRRMERRCFS